MIKKLVKSGNSGAVTIDKAVMDLLSLRIGDYISLTIHNGSIVLTPTRVGAGEEELRASIKRVRKKYDGALKRLAK